jgi:hypothetical protein
MLSLNINLIMLTCPLDAGTIELRLLLPNNHRILAANFSRGDLTRLGRGAKTLETDDVCDGVRHMLYWPMQGLSYWRV